MALNIVKIEKKESTFSWDRWYANNKQKLLEKRAKRYKEDPAYRKAALERSRRQREHRQKKLVVPITDGYTISFVEAAQKIGVSEWVLRDWRRKNYFPEPLKRDGRLWFNDQQIYLLKMLQAYFVEGGRKEMVGDLVGLMYANWN